MNMRVILIALVVLVVGAGVVYLVSQSPSAPSNNNETLSNQQETTDTSTNNSSEEADTSNSNNEVSAPPTTNANSTPATTPASTIDRTSGEAITSDPECVTNVKIATVQENPIACVVTSMGTFEFVLYRDKVPVTAQNFIDLADSGFYDGLIFHRIIANFMFQGGDPTGTGGGGPGHSIDLEIHPELRHDDVGAVAMARTSDPNSAGSQWYVTLEAQPNLDDQYAVFGRVIEGLDVVAAIGLVETGAADRPVEDVVMNRVLIFHPRTDAVEGELRDRDN